MKTSFILLCICVLLFCTSCANTEAADIAATTLPVYEFSARLCEGTDLTVARVVTESVSCLHDYTLQVRQMRILENADLVVISGAGLEDFLQDVLLSKPIVDASAGIELLCGEHNHEAEEHGHSHAEDPHIWLSPAHAKTMAETVCSGLSDMYPQYAHVFRANLETLHNDLDTLAAYGEETLSELTARELITFHDGFSYLAEAFDLEILEALEEESGSEASAAELKHLIQLVNDYQLPAMFIEKNGSVSAAEVISRETGIPIYTLDMAMSGESYFDAMYHNINTLKEALE